MRCVGGWKAKESERAMAATAGKVSARESYLTQATGKMRGIAV